MTALVKDISVSRNQSSSQNEPDDAPRVKCLLVDDENLLNLQGKGFTPIRITETKSAPLGGTGNIEEVSKQEFLLQILLIFPEFVFACSCILSLPL